MLATLQDLLITHVNLAVKLRNGMYLVRYAWAYLHSEIFMRMRNSPSIISLISSKPHLPNATVGQLSARDI